MSDQPPLEAAGPSQPPAGFYPDASGVERFWDGSQWTEHTKAVGPASTMSVPAESPRKRKRVFMWFFLAVQVLFLIWIIAGISSGSGQPSDCGSLDAETCNAASDTGTAIGVALIFAFWAIVDVILGFIYLVVRLARR